MPHSFHAVREIGPDVPHQRWGMQYLYYEPPGGVFHDLSMPDLMRRPETGSRSLADRIAGRVSRWIGGP